MAGSYPDQPSRRMAWDDDGTVVYALKDENTDGDPGLGGAPPSTLTLVEQNSTAKKVLNNDANDEYGDVSIPTVREYGSWVYLFFPEDREIDGYYFNAHASGGTIWSYLSMSSDTTNGIDGTYTAIGTQVKATLDVKPDYRNSFQTAAETGKNSVLVQHGLASGLSVQSAGIRAVHVYGTISPGETPDRLVYLDTLASDAEFTKPLDYGNIGRGTGSIRTFKVKNNSGSLTANTVQITSEDINGGSDMFTFSTDGIADQGTKTLGNIGPGSNVLTYIHLTVTDAYTLDLYEPRCSLTVASWT